MLGGRYDDLRMCVASPAVARGGLVADITFLPRVHFSAACDMTVKLPVMRPLFSASHPVGTVPGGAVEAQMFFQ